MTDLKSVVKSAVEVVSEAGAFITTESKSFNASSVQMKGFNDLVSYVDKTSELMITKGLSSIIRDSGFILEEKTSTVQSDSEWKWIVDPLDGTTNFVHGVPCYCISVGLMKAHEMMAGIVFELNLKEMFTAFKGGGTFKNGERVRVSDTPILSESLIATGFPYNNFGKTEQYMKIFDHCMRNTHGLRRLGSAAVDLAYVACGRFDAFYEYGLNAWDVSAGSILVSEAGGKVSDFKGTDDFVFGREILATNGKVHDEFNKVTAKSFGYS